MKTCLSLILALTFCLPASGQTEVSYKQTWTGYGLANDLKSFAPAKDFIVAQINWEKLWKAWRGSEKLPKVDFRRQIVVVCTTQSPNHCAFNPTLKRGNLQLNAQTTAMRGRDDQFSYRIALINRAGVKTINGTSLTAK